VAVGVFTEKGVGSCVCSGRFSFLLGVTDFPLHDGIVDRADLKWAIKPMDPGVRREWREERLFDSFSSQFEDGVLTLERCPRIAFIEVPPTHLWYSLMS
jgi:hypothetical protein